MSIRVGFITHHSGSRHFHLLQLQRVADKRARSTIIGYHRYGRAELLALRDDSVRVRLWALGVLSFAPNVSPALFEEVFESFTVHGLVRNRPRRR